jgi:hypothetical protein
MIVLWRLAARLCLRYNGLCRNPVPNYPPTSAHARADHGRMMQRRDSEPTSSRRAAAAAIVNRRQFFGDLSLNNVSDFFPD